MSIHRFAARRDANEPEIIARFAHHGWHTEQVSGTGMPDLLAFVPRTRWSTVHLVDVKMPKGALKPAQAKKWTALYAKGIPLYVVRTKEDVDALVAGTLEPWRPVRMLEQPRLPRGAGPKLTTRRANELRAAEKSKEVGARCQRCFAHVSEPCRCSSGRKGYTPPRSESVDAAKEAEAFAPGPPTCRRCGCQIRAMDAGMCNTCLEDQRILGQP